MKSRLPVTSMAVFLSFGVAGIGHAQNGTVEFEIPFNTTVFIDCLGEAVELDLTVAVRTQFIELPNGQVHYVENWFVEGTGTGQSSGFTWYGHGPSPFLSNVNGAQTTNSLLANVTFEPLDGGQKFMEKLRLQLVVDANGALRVDKSQHLQWRCIAA